MSPVTECDACGFGRDEHDDFCARCGLPTGSDWPSSASPVSFGATRRGWGAARSLAGAAVVLAAFLVVVNWAAPSIRIEGLIASTIGRSGFGPGPRVDPVERWAGDGPVIDGVEGQLLISELAHLVLVDIATGDRELYQTEGLVIDVVGRDLVMFKTFGQPAENQLRLVPAADPGDGGRLVLSSPSRTGSRQRVSMLTDEVVFVPGWLAGVVQDPRLVSTDTPAVVRLSDGSAFDAQRFPVPESVWFPGAGTYRRTDDGYRRLGDGRPLTSGPKLTVIEDCADVDRCDRYWVDNESGQKLDRVVTDAVDWSGGYPGRYRWLEAVSHLDDQSVVVRQRSFDDGEPVIYYDTVRDRPIDVPGSDGPPGQRSFDFSFWSDDPAETVFGDGRYLAAIDVDQAAVGTAGDGDRVVIIDLETQSEVASLPYPGPAFPITVRYLPPVRSVTDGLGS